jgi:hypothetical protein
LKIITFYADCHLPDGPRRNQDGFDWRLAIKTMEKSAQRFGYQTAVVTDENTEIDDPWLRFGDAKQDGVMMWLLKAQGAAIASFTGERAVMVSPDTIIAAPLEFLFGRQGLTLFTRRKPKPIVNSVIAFCPSTGLNSLWGEVLNRAETLPHESKVWGADIDALVETARVSPLEDCIRRVGAVDIRLMPITGRFESVRTNGEVRRLNASIWDFKGQRKALMQRYARLVGC